MKMRPITLGICEDCSLVQEAIVLAAGTCTPAGIMSCKECGHPVKRISAFAGFESVSLFVEEE